jgi:hypothetical protein
MIKEDAMGRACSMNLGEEEHMYVFDEKARRNDTRKTKTWVCG